jgi:hypothetical protein
MEEHSVDGYYCSCYCFYDSCCYYYYYCYFFPRRAKVTHETIHI